MYIVGKSYEWQFVTLEELPHIGFTREPNVMTQDVLRHMLFIRQKYEATQLTAPLVYRKRGKLYVVYDRVFYKLEDFITLRRLHGIT
jgi:hypothetical protein